MITERYRLNVYVAAAATAAAVTAVTLSKSESTRIIGTMVLTGVGYGIANDMFACRDCIEYFTVGHKWDGQKLEKRLIQTLDPTLNAVAWGAVATWNESAIAGVALAAFARMPLYGSSLKITSTQLMPWLAMGVVVTLC